MLPSMNKQIDRFTDSKIPYGRLPRGRLFQALLFAAFCLPFKEISYFAVGFAIVDLSEVCFIFLPIVYWFYPRTGIHPLGEASQKWALAALVSIFCFGILRFLFYNESLIGLLKDYRSVLPLISGLVIFVGGVRIQLLSTLKILLLALLLSYSTALILGWLDFGEYFRQFDDSLVEAESISRGRLISDNAPISLLGLILVTLIGRYRLSRDFRILVFSTFLIGGIALVLTFNRTLMVLLPMVLIVSVFGRNFTPQILRISGFLFLFFMVSYSVYLSNEEVRAQVEKRILVVSEGLDALLGVSYYENRELLYAQYVDIIDAYWISGSPSYVPISVSQDPNSASGYKFLRITDISFVTLAVLFGVIPSLVYFLFWVRVWFVSFRMLRVGIDPGFYNHLFCSLLVFAIPFYLLASLNVDLLVRHKSVFVLILFSLAVSVPMRAMLVSKGNR
jgi:hypothetical protein